MKASPLLLAGLAVAGLLVFNQRAKAVAAATGAAAQRTANYYTPTDLANALGGLVVGLTKGISTPQVPGIANVTGPTPPQAGGTSLFGGGLFGSGPVASDPNSAWTFPTLGNSLVKDPGVSGLSPTVDAIVAAPVYDISNDFTNNWTG
jgi:hypothetical protein